MSLHLTRALDMVELCGTLGFSVVPRSPNGIMINAGLTSLNGDATRLASAYTAMIDAGALE